MTTDGTGDDLIKIQGLTDTYSFTDADGGNQGCESDAEEDTADHADLAANEEGAVAEGKDGEEDEWEDGLDSTDEEDDT